MVSHGQQAHNLVFLDFCESTIADFFPQCVVLIRIGPYILVRVGHLIQLRGNLCYLGCFQVHATEILI